MAKLPIAEFIEERLLEYDSTYEVRKGTGFYELFFKPHEFLLQPLRDEADVIQVAQSFRRILQQEDPDAFDEESVDALAANLFVTRVEGDFSAGTARVYYDRAVSREWPEGGAVFSGNNGKTYSNPSPFSITEVQMGNQIENGLFYYDIPIVATEKGDDSDLEIGGLVSLAGDSDVITVSNLQEIKGGVSRESNTALIERTQKSIAVRDLVTGKGVNAILFENFANTLTEIQPIGFGDDEMMRDIVYNTHIGGKVDIYVKTPDTTIKTKNFIGLLIDTTRQAKSTTNVELFGTNWGSLGVTNIDRSGGKDPIVKQIKTSTAATYTSPVDLSTPVNLSAAKHVSITIDGVTREVNLSGSVPTATTRNEIVSKINNAFGDDVAVSVGNSFKLTSPTKGLSSELVLAHPVSLPSALLAVFGVTVTTPVFGDGPVTFVENDHYEMSDADGEIRRIVGPVVIPASSTGETVAGSNVFNDPTPNKFGPSPQVSVNHILTITSGPDIGDYRITEVTDDNNLVLDTELTATTSGVSYIIRNTGIKDSEVVYVEYYYNPLSIDIGKLVRLDSLGKTRGIRPGRDDQTITDVPFLRVTKIELIDPVTEEPLGQVLNGLGGYGVGGYGEGPYGVGSGTDYYMVVNYPHERYSAFEDSYIVISSSYQGFSFSVEYECVPEVEAVHTFCRSESERVLDGDILVKHFLPVYVEGSIEYEVDTTDSSIPDNDSLTESVKSFINTRSSGSPLDLTDIRQFLLKTVDPFYRYGSSIKPFELKATVLNSDGSTTSFRSNDKLTVPTLNPFPKDTRRPLSPRITHWIAGDIVLTRL